MNPETEKELLRQLEKATSRELLENDRLDDETTLLRESWLSLGQLLAAREGFEPIVTLAAREKNNVRWNRAWILAVAAMAFVMLLSGWFFVGLPLSLHKLDMSHMENQGDLDNHYDELAWDDSLDRELARARLAIWHAGGSRERRDLNWQYLRGELQQISEDLEEDSL